nr:MAG TPA: hypothetical protein [Caudoviricetes sp.]DAR75279.1 MAG TPA: hypothetical protein [Caudoviricetes sp.]DAS27873.1 MAG TPA: hypothetical protein [Caudoviricetes sp.]DAY23593.1 MAG TPA: hypothetical protein [Caudoviricetes sp.]
MEAIIKKTKKFWLNRMVVFELILSVVIMYIFTFRY